MKHIFITGISGGLGAYLTRKFVEVGNFQITGVSRKKPIYLTPEYPIQWQKFDLNQTEKINSSIPTILNNQIMDALILNVGIWEKTAFSSDYSFEEMEYAEIYQLIQVNITANIELVRSILKQGFLKKGGKIIFIGSTWGLENHGGKEVVFSATKFALRGMVHSLRENLKHQMISPSVLNLGYLSENEYPQLPQEIQIPLIDVWKAIQFLLATSPYSCVKEIDMPGMFDSNC